jgi:hypothetical protein
MIKNFFSNKLRVMIVIYIFFIVIVVVVSLLVSNAAKDAPELEADTPVYPFMTIANYDEIVENVPISDKRIIEGALYNAASLNTEQIPSDAVANIRDGSFSQYIENEVYYTNYIVDIKSLEQSYLINGYSTFVDRSIDYPVIVTCPVKSIMIYLDFDCIDEQMLM